MPAPFDRVAYVLIRAHVLDAWRYLAILDGDGREILRTEYATDPRCNVMQNAATGELAITMRLRGDDFEIAERRPLRISGSRLYAAPEGGESLHPTSIDPAMLIDATDGLIYTHRLYVPFHDSTSV